MAFISYNFDSWTDNEDILISFKYIFKGMW
jgi:hypothetical protein